jgi:DegV family protein with EDD domain
MIKITADSTCDLPAELLERLNVTPAPLYALVDGESYRDGVDIAPDDIFRFAEAGRRVRTAAANPCDYERLFERFAGDHEAVIHIAIGQQFSACYGNARLAAQGFSNVYVVDSRNLSSGSGHVVMDAAEMARDGLPAEEIVAALGEIIPRVDASFVIENLDCLRRGGRCTGLEAAGARLLQIKPCIEVVGGEMKVGKKYRGSFEHCLEHYARDRLADCGDIDYSRVFLTHPACAAETVGLVRGIVERLAPFEEVIETRAGCTVSCHCGPATLGVLFKRTHPKTALAVR